MSTQMWYDEIHYFQREPTVMEGMFEALANSHNWFDPVALKRAERTHARLKREREMANCLHGRRPFPINWRPGTHPLGERTFWANIDGMAGGPYLLNEADHQILHDVGRRHEHVQTSSVRDDRVRKVAKLLAP